MLRANAEFMKVKKMLTLHIHSEARTYNEPNLTEQLLSMMILGELRNDCNPHATSYPI